MRTGFSKVQSGKQRAPRSKQQLRNRAKAQLAQEKKALDEVLAHAAKSGVVTIPQIKPKLEAKLGKTLALSSVYRMLSRHNWRKLAPDTQHPKANAEAREDWEKTARHAGGNPRQLQPRA
ncbi:MAG: winged helix-turn-helix domain-containing protein, partial [Pseudomonadota bacterium]